MYDNAEVERDYICPEGLAQGATKEGEVARELGRTKELTMSLEKEVQVLLKRIEPILENVPSIPENNEKVLGPANNSMLASQICANNDSLLASLNRLRGIRNRIAL